MNTARGHRASRRNVIRNAPTVAELKALTQELNSTYIDYMKQILYVSDRFGQFSDQEERIIDQMNLFLDEQYKKIERKEKMLY